MDINVSTSMSFENKDFMNNSGKNMVNYNHTQHENAEEKANNTIFDSKNNASISALQILGLSIQASLNNSLNETLKYLKTHSNNKKKDYILGELWAEFISIQNENEEIYNGELIDFEVDMSQKNIFAA